MKKIILLLSALVMLAATVNAQLPSGQFLGADHNYCPGGAGLGFNGAETGFNPNWTYLWSTGETTQQIFFPYPTAGYYTVWCKVSLNGNSVTDTVHYTVSPAVDVPVLNTTASSACVDSTVVSTPFTQGYTYQWYKSDQNNPGTFILLSGQTGNALIVTVSNTYRVKVTNQGGCFEYGQLAVATLGKPKKYLHDTAYCQTIGQPNFNINDNININCTYLWNQGNTGANWVINPNDYLPNGATYWVTITNANGCQTVDTINWVAHPRPNPILNGNQYTCGDLVTLKDNNTSYDHVWSYNNNVISNQDSVIVNTLGVYTVVTTNQYGCSVSNNLSVLSSSYVGLAGFNFIPNLPNHPREFSFSPLGDVNANEYHWDFGDGNTSDQKFPNHTYVNDDTTAIVTLTVTNTNYTGVCKSKTLSQRIATGTDVDTTTPPPTSIKEIEDAAGMSLYPNPVRDNVNIILKEGTIINVTVTDLAGRNIYTESSKSKEIRVNLNNINAGVYIIRVDVKTSKGEGTIVRKINKF